MSWRTLIVNTHSKLDYKLGYIVIRGIETHRVLLDEIAILIIENPAVSITGCLLEVLIEKKIKVIICDSQHNPTAELVPHHGCHDSTTKIKAQLGWDNEIKNSVWKEIVKEKIRKQAFLLQETGHDRQAEMLISYICQVESRDATNREGHAAKVYFHALFGKNFSRSQPSPINAALNYGYSILLAAFNREISANGYLTQLGVFHDNMFNPFNLGCDLMETFRPLIDRWVLSEIGSTFGIEEKHKLWNIFHTQVCICGKKQALLNAISIYTKSVFDAMNESNVTKMCAYSLEDE